MLQQVRDRLLGVNRIFIAGIIQAGDNAYAVDAIRMFPFKISDILYAHATAHGIGAQRAHGSQIGGGIAPRWDGDARLLPKGHRWNHRPERNGKISFHDYVFDLIIYVLKRAYFIPKFHEPTFVL